MKRLILVLAALTLSGCAVFNPYEENFRCRRTDSGRCVDVPTAYHMAKDLDGNTARAANTEYEESLYRRVTELLQAPSTPVVAPPKVMRVLMLPYEGDGNELFMPRYAYIFLDRPRWVLTDPFARGGK